MSKLIWAVVVVASVCSAVYGADKPLPADKQAKVLERQPGADANNDGVVTQEEVRAAMARRQGAGPQGPGPGPWALLVPMDPQEILKVDPQADTNGDGKLDPQERRAFAETRRQTLEKELLAENPGIDANGDGALTPDEMRAGREVVEQFVSSRVLAAHPQADKDGDGKLSREELRVFQSARMPGGPPDSPAAHVDWIVRNFQQIDADGNGQLTLEELQSYKRELSPPKEGAEPKRPRARAQGADAGGAPGGQKRERKARGGEAPARNR